MGKSKITTILSLALAPLMLLVIKQFDINSESLTHLLLRLFPALLSSMFFFFFLNSYINKKNLILRFTKKFYHKELSVAELNYLSKGDGYWVIVTFLNTVIQVFTGLFCSDLIWVFYSSIGWYFYIFTALIIQIVYGKIYAIKRFVN